jgi:hypothetical protein
MTIFKIDNIDIKKKVRFCARSILIKYRNIPIDSEVLLDLLLSKLNTNKNEAFDYIIKTSEDFITTIYIKVKKQI